MVFLGNFHLLLRYFLGQLLVKLLSFQFFLEIDNEKLNDAD